jgi:mannose-6-phosphate isomerase-like protein (cupin superfamily)
MQQQMRSVEDIYCIDEHDRQWVEYEGLGPTGIRVKPLTAGVDTCARIAFIEYPPGYADDIHHHDESEVFLVSEGMLSLDGTAYGPGSILCIPRDQDYALHAGPDGARYFRIWNVA